MMDDLLRTNLPKHKSNGFIHRTAEPIRLPRIQDQVHVVWHQAVSLQAAT